MRGRFGFGRRAGTDSGREASLVVGGYKQAECDYTKRRKLFGLWRTRRWQGRCRRASGYADGNRPRWQRFNWRYNLPTNDTDLYKLRLYSVFQLSCFDGDQSGGSRCRRVKTQMCRLWICLPAVPTYTTLPSDRMSRLSGEEEARWTLLCP